MSKNFNNGGRRYNDNGVGSAENQNGRNQGMLIDPSKFVTDSNDIKSFDITTSDAQKFLQANATMIDRAIEKRLGKSEGEINTKVQLMSVNFSGKDKQPFVPFLMMVSGNIIDRRTMDDDIPSILKPDIDNGVHLNSVYYNQLFAPYMYNKDDIKAFNSPSYRRGMHITLPFSTLNELKKYMKPKIEFTNGNREDVNNAQVVVMIDPIRLFNKLVFDRNNPRARYKVFVKNATKIDDLNFTFRVERHINHMDQSGLANIEVLKKFLANGNSGIR